MSPGSGATCADTSGLGILLLRSKPEFFEFEVLTPPSAPVFRLTVRVPCGAKDLPNCKGMSWAHLALLGALNAEIVDCGEAIIVGDLQQETLRWRTIRDSRRVIGWGSAKNMKFKKGDSVRLLINHEHAFRVGDVGTVEGPAHEDSSRVVVNFGPYTQRLRVLKSPEDGQIEHVSSSFMREHDPVHGGQRATKTRWSHVVLGRQDNHYDQTDQDRMLKRFMQHFPAA